MSYNNKTQPNVYQSNIQMMEGKEGFTALFFSHLNRMSASINSSELGVMHNNIYYNALFIINHIPDPEIRKNLTTNLKTRINQMREEGKEENAAVTTAAIECIGNVMDFWDGMLGIVRESKIAVSLDCSDCPHRLKAEATETANPSAPNLQLSTTPIAPSTPGDDEL